MQSQAFLRDRLHALRAILEIQRFWDSSYFDQDLCREESRTSEALSTISDQIQKRSLALSRSVRGPLASGELEDSWYNNWSDILHISTPPKLSIQLLPPQLEHSIIQNYINHIKERQGRICNLNLSGCDTLEAIVYDRSYDSKKRYLIGQLPRESPRVTDTKIALKCDEKIITMSVHTSDFQRRSGVHSDNSRSVQEAITYVEFKTSQNRTFRFGRVTRSSTIPQEFSFPSGTFLYDFNHNPGAYGIAQLRPVKAEFIKTEL